MFTGALFVITKKQKQPKCSSIGEWLNYGTSTPWHNNQQFKKKSGRSSEKKKSQSQKIIYCMILFI